MSENGNYRRGNELVGIGADSRYVEKHIKETTIFEKVLILEIAGRLCVKLRG